MEQLKEGRWNTMLHMKKLRDKFRKQTEEDIEIATTTALQELCGQAVEIQVLQADRDKKGPGF